MTQTDEPSVDPVRSRIMRSVGLKKTKPEMLVRRALHSIDYRFRVNLKALPGSPDLAFTARKKVIFVHGCFWHRHLNCRLATTPKTRLGFWEDKFKRNVERDARKVAELERLGWEVMTVWECETRQMDSILPRIVEFLGKPTATSRQPPHSVAPGPHPILPYDAAKAETSWSS